MSLLVQINRSVSLRLGAAMGAGTVVMDQTNNAVSTVVNLFLNSCIYFNIYCGLCFFHPESITKNNNNHADLQILFFQKKERKKKLCTKSPIYKNIS